MSRETVDDSALQAGIVDRLSGGAALFGGYVVLATGGLIVSSISARWLFATSVPGDVELIQTATAIAAFAFLPLGQITRSTIVVDTFTKRLSNRACLRIDALWDLVYAVVALFLSWRLAIGAFDALRSNTITTVLGLPIGWPMIVSTIFLVLLAAAAATMVIRESRSSL